MYIIGLGRITIVYQACRGALRGALIDFRLLLLQLLFHPQLSLFAVCCAVTPHDTPSGQLQSEDQICRFERLKESVTFSRVVDSSAREGFALRMFSRVQSIRGLCHQYRLQRHPVKPSMLRLDCRLVILVTICSINPNDINQESVYMEIPVDLSLGTSGTRAYSIA